MEKVLAPAQNPEEHHDWLLCFDDSFKGGIRVLLHFTNWCPWSYDCLVCFFFFNGLRCLCRWRRTQWSRSSRSRTSWSGLRCEPLSHCSPSPRPRSHRWCQSFSLRSHLTRSWRLSSTPSRETPALPTWSPWIPVKKTPWTKRSSHDATRHHPLLER